MHYAMVSSRPEEEGQSSYKYPRLKTPMREIFVLVLTCKVSIMGIGRVAKTKSVKMLTAVCMLALTNTFFIEGAAYIH